MPLSDPLALQAEQRILLLREQKVMLDFHMAELYAVETRALKQAVRRNPGRFPADFMFELTAEEARMLVSQNVIPGLGKLGGASPMAFTEQGVAMLSSVLRGDRAIEVNIAIMRAFVRLREMLATHADLARKLEAMEKKYDGQFRIVFDAIRQLMAPAAKPAREMGFHTLPKPKLAKKVSRRKAWSSSSATNEPHRLNPESRSYLSELAQETGRENAITSSGNPIPGSSFSDKARASA